MGNLKIVKAKNKHKSIINNLIQYYLYDMSEYYSDCSIGQDGRYEYTMLNQFWQHPYLIYYNSELIGFALVIDHCPITQDKPCWFMAEFFIIRKHRRKGLASRAINIIFGMHNSKWYIGIISKNIQANKFWKKSLSNLPIISSNDYQHDGSQWRIFEINQPSK